MNLLLIVNILGICAFTHAAVNFEHKLPIVNSVNAGFENSHLEVNLLAREHELTSDDELLVTGLTEYENRNAIADLIKDALEDFRDIVFNGNDDIPVLDPLHIPQIGPYDYITTGVRARGTIHDFRMEGLGWYIVDEVTFNVLRLALGVHVTVPRLTFTGRYDAQATVLFATYRAGGNYRVFVNKLEVDVGLRLGTNLAAGGSLVLRELNIKIDAQVIHFEIDGMTGSNLINNFINAFINSITQEVVQNQMDTISQILSEQLFDVINEILKDFTINDILG